MNTKAALLFHVIGIAASLAGCGGGKEAAPLERPVETVTVRSGALSEAAAFAGDVRARHENDLAFRVGGKMIERRVDVGAAVRKGQVLARIDPADAALQASQAEAQRALAAAETQRFRDLRAKNFVSQAALDARETALKTAAAQAAVARNQAGYTALVADRDGVVTAVMAEAGQVVGAGQPVLRFARPEEKEVLVSVSESRVKEVRTAADAVVTLWAHPARHYSGRVREIAPAADAATRTFAVRVAILDSDADVRLGMSASVVFGAVREGGILLPLTAVLQRDGRAAVWIVDAQARTVQPRSVEIAGYREDGAVVAAGVRDGEIVVARGAHKLIAGQKVRLAEGGARVAAAGGPAERGRE